MATSRLPDFQENFKALRGDMTQGQFAEKLGISRATVALYESGARIPDAEVLRDIAQRCCVSADYLLGLSKIPTNDKDLAFVCNYTGLSERAVNMLEFTQHFPGYSEAIDSLLSDSCMWMSNYLHEIRIITDDLKSKMANGFKMEEADVIADAATRLELVLYRFSKSCDALPDDLYSASSVLEKADEYADLVILNDPGPC